MNVEPYLIFNGRCQEAAEFYAKAIDAQILSVMYFKDNPEPPPGGVAPEMADKVMHMLMTIGDSKVMASDGHCIQSEQEKFQGFSLTLNAESDDRAKELYAALLDGGQATMPLSKTFFASSFGMLTDRFGVSWIVIVPTY